MTSHENPLLGTSTFQVWEAWHPPTLWPINVNHDLTDRICLISIKNNNNVLFETSNLLFLVVTFHILTGCHRGGTQIWKWGISAYRRTKRGGVQCKILSRKGSFGVGTTKKKKKKKKKTWGLVWCGLPKMGVIQCAEMQFQGKICKFSVKIATKLWNFSKCVQIEVGKNLQFLCKIWFKSGKRGSMGVDWKKRGHWV